MGFHCPGPVFETKPVVCRQHQMTVRLQMLFQNVQRLLFRMFSGKIPMCFRQHTRGHDPVESRKSFQCCPHTASEDGDIIHPLPPFCQQSAPAHTFFQTDDFLCLLCKSPRQLSAVGTKFQHRIRLFHGQPFCQIPAKMG